LNRSQAGNLKGVHAVALIGITDFVRRQTPESKYNHFEGSWDELVRLVERHWEERKTSPHNTGVVLVPMPESLVRRFYCSIVEVTPGMPLQAEFAPRVAGEYAFIQVSAPGVSKSPARRAEIILYSHGTLAQDGDAPPTCEAEWYVVSVNAYATPDDEPMNPMTMARNLLGLTGGTRPLVPYTAEEFAHAIIYWSHHVRAGGK
jgi:hypothetical protein